MTSMTMRLGYEKFDTVSKTEVLEEKIKQASEETDLKIKYAINTYDAQFQPTTIISGVHPKKQSNNKFIQWILLKIFGYEFEYKTVMAKTIVIKAEDCPAGFYGNFTFTIEEEAK